MGKVEDAVASFERNIEAQTGRSVATWAALVSDRGFAKHGQMVAWLKAEHMLSHGYANHIANRVVRTASPAAADDPVAALFAGAKVGLRPMYDRLIETARQFGSDVEIAPKKANVSLRRARQFGLIQPSTGARLDLGLILKDRPPAGRLEPSGSFNAMFTHRIRLTDASQIDDEVVGWMREAYDEAV